MNRANEQIKVLRNIHLTLIIASGTILLFALTPSKISDYKKALEELSTLDELIETGEIGAFFPSSYESNMEMYEMINEQVDQQLNSNSSNGIELLMLPYETRIPFNDSCKVYTSIFVDNIEFVNYQSVQSYNYRSVRDYTWLLRGNHYRYISPYSLTSMSLNPDQFRFVDSIKHMVRYLLIRPNQAWVDSLLSNSNQGTFPSNLENAGFESEQDFIEAIKGSSMPTFLSNSFSTLAKSSRIFYHRIFFTSIGPPTSTNFIFYGQDSVEIGKIDISRPIIIPRPFNLAGIIPRELSNGLYGDEVGEFIVPLPTTQNKFWISVRDLSPTEAFTQLNNELSNHKETLNLSFFTIEKDAMEIGSPVTILVILGLFYFHLWNLKKIVSEEECSQQSEYSIPWSILFKHKFIPVIAIATIIIFPLVSVTMLLVKIESRLILIICCAVAILLLSYACAKVVHHIRSSFII